MNTALYLRISLDRSGEALGVGRQEEDCRDLAASLDWEIVDTYIDNDISASSGKTRPGYRRMLDDITSGTIEAVIAWAPDRLYRRIADLEELITIIEGNSVAVRTVKAGDLDLSSAYGRMIARILGAVSAGEGEIKSDRWRRSVRQRREAGAPPSWGPRLYGYTREGEIVQDEATLLRDVAEQVLDGASLRGLAARLNAAGERTSLDNEWTANSLRTLLRNRRLIGESVLSRKYTHKRADGKTVTRYHKSTVGVGDWQPILEVDAFEKLQALLAARSGTPRKPRVAVLRGLIYCGKCETALVTGGRAGRNGPPLRIYRCPRVPGGTSGCGGISIAAEPVEEIVEAYARVRLQDPRVHQRAAEMQGQSAEVVSEIHALGQRVSEIDEQLGLPGVPIATLLAARERAQNRLEDLSGQLAQTPPQTLPRGNTPWPKDLGRRHALIALVVASVKIRPATKGAKAFEPERVQIDPR